MFTLTGPACGWFRWGDVHWAHKRLLPWVFFLGGHLKRFDIKQLDFHSCFHQDFSPLVQKAASIRSAHGWLQLELCSISPVKSWQRRSTKSARFLPCEACMLGILNLKNKSVHWSQSRAARTIKTFSPQSKNHQQKIIKPFETLIFKRIQQKD